MALTSGTRLGPYEILAPIGAGGMGEVYRARDARLDRTVAIKVSRAQFSERFEREARAVAALNHSHICTLYDVGPSYLVMEYIEGTPLKGPVPLERALQYAAQICDALDAAHSKGITHRDLKPGNILVTKNGIKLLDFGLAKRTGQMADTDVTQAMTQEGAISGTLNYMSPEQLQGNEADARSDIFSFGLVLYEMLAGKRAYQGQNAASVIAAIIERPAPSIAGVAPPSIDRILQRCLAKDPDDRWQSARDLAFVLEQASGTTAAYASPAAAAPRRRFLPLAIAAACTLAIAALAAIAFLKSGHRTQPVFHQLTANRGCIRRARFSPDGQTVLFGGAWNGDPAKLWLERADDNSSSPLSAPDADLLSISPKGDLAIALNYAGSIEDPEGTLALTGFAGGAPREVLEHVLDADWSRDGTALAISHRVSGRVRLEYPIGKVLYETAGYVSHLRFSHRGDQIAFLDHPRPGDNRGSVAVIDLAGKKKMLTPEYNALEGLAWTPDDGEVWFSAGVPGTGTAFVFEAVSLSGKIREVFRAPASLVLQDIAQDGRVLLATDADRVDITVGDVPSRAEKDLTWVDFSWHQYLSDDGKWIVFCKQDKNYATYARKTDGTPAILLGEGEPQAISPDGAWVVSATPPADQSVNLLPFRGQPRTLKWQNMHLVRLPMLWMPDSRSLILSGTEKNHASRSYLLSIDGGEPRAITPEGLTAVLLSPDGKRLLASSEVTKLLVVPLGGGEPRLLATIGEDDLPIEWLGDGRTIIIQSGYSTKTIVDAYQIDAETGARKPWKQFVPRERTGLLSFYSFGVTPDGSRYLMADLHRFSTLFLAAGLK